MSDCDCLIIGAGAAGMMCALEAAKRGRRVRLVDHADKIGEKIRISGGGRCNFTNINASAEHYLSENPHFCKSALKRYRPRDFIAMVERHHIAYHEKEAGQLFCNDSAQQITDILLQELAQVGVRPELKTTISDVEAIEGGFRLRANRESATTNTLVVATGGKSIPKIGASGFGYKLAEQFGLKIVEPRPGLVPLTFDSRLKEAFQILTGISVEARVGCRGKTFTAPLLFTHRGLSGPAILQISSFWREGEKLSVDLLPGTNLDEYLRTEADAHGRQSVETVLATLLPKRLATYLCKDARIAGRLAELSRAKREQLSALVHNWELQPVGTEGYRTAEVTLGGVNTSELSSKTFEARLVPGLYFIGEVVDVTGWLGGYNFQWAWSSGWCAGAFV